MSVIDFALRAVPDIVPWPTESSNLLDEDTGQPVQYQVARLWEDLVELVGRLKGAPTACHVDTAYLVRGPAITVTPTAAHELTISTTSSGCTKTTAVSSTEFTRIIAAF
ncbi:hypothetical protein [Herbiconiux liangxiaofengii]|uniref:hypothetical protein n=1 Tax=Herbiconiux liangxiaofengii TaxID=3342795 RepID=UPI0035BB4997